MYYPSHSLNLSLSPSRVWINFIAGDICIPRHKHVPGAITHGDEYAYRDGSHYAGDDIDLAFLG